MAKKCKLESGCVQHLGKLRGTSETVIGRKAIRFLTGIFWHVDMD